jgi:abortive infection bacteriophage resistance protein
MLFQSPDGPLPPPPGNIEEQVKWLGARGLESPDREYASRCLSHIGFHRLSAYWARFMGQGDVFGAGATFSDVMVRYMLDQRLRSLVLEGTSYIEVSIRTRWTTEVASRSILGDYGHKDGSLFQPKRHSKNLQRLEEDYNNANKPGNPFDNATIWEVAEAMPFGQLSMWYQSIKDRQIKRAIAENYAVDQKTFGSLLIHHSLVRNICAHHGRLWDRHLNSPPRIPSQLGENENVDLWFNGDQEHKIYNLLVFMAYLLDVVTPNGDWAKRLVALASGAVTKGVPEVDMGFPEGWSELEIWSA